MEPAAPPRVGLTAEFCLAGADSVGCPDLREQPHVAGTRSAASPDLVAIFILVVTAASPGLSGQEQGSIVGRVLDQETADLWGG